MPKRVSARCTAPLPSFAFHIWWPWPVVASAMRMDQGGAVRSLVGGGWGEPGMRMKAICLLSGDQTGSMSFSVLASR